MYTKLTMPERLKDLRVNDKKLTLEQLADETGLSRSALGRYENDENIDISPFAITTLAEFYGVSTGYLLGLTENKNPVDEDIEDLHLSDDAIELLENGKINNRLLCELITHPDFPRLLTDIEICVDRIADMHIKDMNYLLDQVREEVQEKYNPEENDVAQRTLDLAQVDEKIFYGQVIHDDLDDIVKDIRDDHMKDSNTADEDVSAKATEEEVKKMLDDALNFNGTVDQRRAYLICETLKIDYDKLPEEEQKALEKVCKKSPLMLSVINQRGKAMFQGHAKPKRKKT